MKKFILTLFSFAELTEQAKQKAIEKLHDINLTGLAWWDFIYEDAANIGLVISSFDIQIKPVAWGKLKQHNVFAANKIITDHGEECETYQLAKKFLKEHLEIQEKLTEALSRSEKEDVEIENLELQGGDLDDKFEESLLDAYAKMIQKEYEYRCTKEAIIETIEANEYLFKEDGTLTAPHGMEEADDSAMEALKSIQGNLKTNIEQNQLMTLQEMYAALRIINRVINKKRRVV